MSSYPQHVAAAVEYFRRLWAERGWTAWSDYSVAERLGYEPYQGDITVAYQVGAPACGYWYNWWIRLPAEPPVPKQYLDWMERFVASYPECRAARTEQELIQAGDQQVAAAIGTDLMAQRRGRYVPRVPAMAVSDALEVLFA